MIRRYLYVMTALIALMLLCTACGGNEPTPPVENTPPAAEEQQPTTPPAVEESPVEQPTDPVSPEQETEEENVPEAPAFDFSVLENLEFTFSSGAGGWRTVLYIHADGTFDGLYTDSEMGDIGENYPNGTYYVSEFYGRFAAPVPVNDYTWRMEVSELNYNHSFDEELKDGMRYVYAEANGLAGAKTMELYAPGAPLAELSESYCSWVGYYDLTQIEETELPFWGLYDPVAETGFASYPLPDPAELFRTELATAEQLAAQAEETLQTAMTQTDMNLAAAELYRIWDDTLNIAWMYLKQALDQESMQQLTAEQLDWITEKEHAVAAAGAEYEGGSMQGMVMNLEAAELTCQRVYVLAEYLK